MSNGSEGTKTIKVEVIAGVVIEKDGRYVLVQESIPKAYGTWNFPAGKVDEGETIEQAAVRECKEECGLDVSLKKHVFVLHETAAAPVKHAFSTKIIGGELQKEEGLLDIGWFALEEIKKLPLRNAAYILGAIEASRH
ncbi:MAG TPA: NUDIX domain-containing protein [Candidatus Saccharibacteria bacterium]|nr:NUDIX domain-containing protein [Candidatus Saccharibacteria bacterium]